MMIRAVESLLEKLKLILMRIKLASYKEPGLLNLYTGCPNFSTILVRIVLD